MVLSLQTRKIVMISIGLLLITGLVFGVLAISGVFSKKHSGSPSPTPPPIPIPPTPPDLGLEVVAVSPDQKTIIYDNENIKEDSNDGKYFYFIRGTKDEYSNIYKTINNKLLNYGDKITRKTNEIPVQQWRNTGSKYEKMWEGTVNLINGVGGRLQPYYLDQTNSTGNPNIWMIGDYVVLDDSVLN